MKPIYIFSSGRLTRRQHTLFLETEEGKRPIPIQQVSEIYAFGELELNKRLLEFLTQHRVPMHFFNRYGYYVGTYYPREFLSSGHLTLKQAEHYLNPQLRLDLARRFVRGALWNLVRVLAYYARRDAELEAPIRTIEDLQEAVMETNSIPELMALEGNAREVYYHAWEHILPDSFTLTTRTRRPPTTPANALVSFLNSLLYTATLAQIYQTHLDPRIGYLHETNYRRHTLNLDVAEVFKPTYVDRLIFRLVNRKQLSQKHFLKEGGGVFLNDAGRKTVLKEWEDFLQSTYKHPKLGRHVSWRTTLRLELYKLEKHLLGDRPYEPFKHRG
ncbi:type I-B CRISPR-associated endonuclease Cas1b [Marinithermus hydrothermalis]|uniref:CRISPR-associated endonuclease Cas1 n=1 Tax=Marinithermus hydrothermalis (strain DSM 14884 / JCM 11576 / T1) TaxID=869210 RepID=F2NN56_MARHT|nr:type I-B CRISPR-associated endonuclease Cas1b [Marinithermus hydrothermalis]AEB12795.1 CRISPR-associated protein Cas1 [Marinithermus hydrothermalis DSM 14884]